MDELVDGEEVVKKLTEVYKSLNDVDLYVLGLAEKPVRGALLGPTFSCIIALQFQKVFSVLVQIFETFRFSR